MVLLLWIGEIQGKIGYKVRMLRLTSGNRKKDRIWNEDGEDEVCRCGNKPMSLKEQKFVFSSVYRYNPKPTSKSVFWSLR